ncbi:MAG: ribosomal-protein-alanine N-acetyltransferase [Ruminococcaceae bacterium]|nr:ribosomal-protein-alanine N-acetyltransferase [Oscillospiraceae bacterium]
MENIKYVKLNISHSEDIQRIEELCFKDPWSIVSVANELKNKNSFYIGIVDTNVDILVGYAVFRHIIDEVEVLRVAVRPEYRRNGFAAKMIKKLESEWLDYDIEYARLEVREGNFAARGLYESLGFVPEFIRKGYYSDGENAVLMKKTY